MDGMDLMDREREARVRAEFVERLTRLMPRDGIRDVLPGLRLARAAEPTERVYGVFKPSVCVVAQGAKEIVIGDSQYRYDAETYLIATVELPLTGRVMEASSEEPYLSLRLELDATVISSLMVESGFALPPSHADAKAVFVSHLDLELREAFVRLIRLLDSPREAGVLLPMIKREIVYRLLIGEQGHRLRHVPLMGSHANRISRAVEKLRREYNQAISMEALARELGMSTSGFHHHFKTVMDLSPLQYQKLIRLQEARQLMLGESLDASTAGYRVGYDDPSHFSRDYKKHFGDSPMRDVERLRMMASAD